MTTNQQARPGPDARPVELVPARMLNEFAYCPRLAYLEWAQVPFDKARIARVGQSLEQLRGNRRRSAGRWWCGALFRAKMQAREAAGCAPQRGELAASQLGNPSMTK